ncbi:hypothetical protein MASR2M39_12810 [Ignavibacteriales bacterium]
MEGGMKVSDASRKFDIPVPVILHESVFEGALETFSAPVGRNPLISMIKK